MDISYLMDWEIRERRDDDGKCRNEVEKEDQMF